MQPVTVADLEARDAQDYNIVEVRRLIVAADSLIDFYRDMRAYIQRRLAAHVDIGMAAPIIITGRRLAPAKRWIEWAAITARTRDGDSVVAVCEIVETIPPDAITRYEFAPIGTVLPRGVINARRLPVQRDDDADDIARDRDTVLEMCGGDHLKFETFTRWVRDTIVGHRTGVAVVVRSHRRALDQFLVHVFGCISNHVKYITVTCLEWIVNHLAANDNLYVFAARDCERTNESRYGESRWQLVRDLMSADLVMIHHPEARTIERNMLAFVFTITPDMEPPPVPHIVIDLVYYWEPLATFVSAIAREIEP